MYHTRALDTSSPSTAVRIPRVKLSSVLWNRYHVYLSFGFPVKFRVCFSKPALIWACLKAGLRRAGREEATVGEFVPSGVQRSVLPQHPPLLEHRLPLKAPHFIRVKHLPSSPSCGILSNILHTDHGLLLRSSAQSTGKILALGMMSASSVSTQMKTPDVACGMTLCFH